MDGTFLHSSGKVTKTSCGIMQPLIDEGILFAVATGRTRDNALGSLIPLKLSLPLICDNGTLIFDPKSQSFINKKTIPAEHAQYAIELIRSHGVYPFINTLHADSINVYYGETPNIAQQTYYSQRSAYGLSRYIKDITYTKFLESSAFNFSMLDTYENLHKLYDVFKSNENYTSLLFPAEYFEGFYWLEILPANSGKGQAVDFLAAKYSPDEIICFGDNLNDLCMFERADIKVTPSNAVDEVKKTADIVIGHCDSDSVANFILEHEKG